MSLLQINRLSISFQSEHELVPALHDVSLSVEAGEILALVGESGSGKSITALSILRLLPEKAVRYPSGDIIYTGENGERTNMLAADADSLSTIRGNEIAMIFQEPMTSLNPVFTCGEQVMEAIQLHRKLSKPLAKAETLKLFKQVRLPDPELAFNKYPYQLSGGQKQRVMIAMAMSCEPRLLICDEPTTALDVTVQKTILELIRDLQRERGMGVVFITHDLGVVAEIADKVVVMYMGQIVESGSVSEVLQQPQHPYTQGLLACRPALHKKGERLPVVAEFLNGIQKSQTVPQEREQPRVFGDPLLKVTDLSVSYPGRKNFFGRPLSFVHAVDHVSFEMFKGETLGLVGESGCGKTTLGRALLRLVEPDSGTILLDDTDIRKLDGAEMRRLRKAMQIVFQDPYSSLNPRITIGNAIEEVLAVHRIGNNKDARRARVEELLEKVSMKKEHYNRYPHEFSGGQRQRIVIARALALNPSFIVCDESVSALDVSVQAQVLNLLNDLKKEFGFTVIFISHDLSVVHYISDRIMVMQQGRIIEVGPAEEVYHRPKEEYTRKLIDSIPGRRVEIDH